MKTLHDYGLGEAIEIIDRSLYGTHELPESGRLEYAHRQMIVMQHINLVSVLLDVMNRPISRVGRVKK